MRLNMPRSHWGVTPGSMPCLYSRAVWLCRLITQKFFDVLNVALKLRYIRSQGNGAFELVAGLEEVTQLHVTQASTNEGAKMNSVETKGFMASANRLCQPPRGV